MKRFLICLQYYHGDRDEARNLANFIGQIEPAKRHDCDVIMVRRSDCPAIQNDAIQSLSDKIFVRHINVDTKGADGHPKGCNAMARGLFEKLRNFQAIDAYIFIEPDCVPVDRGWISKLIAEWDSAKAKDPKILALGCLRRSGVDVPHVNGNAIWSSDFADRVDTSFGRSSFGWDSAWAPQYMAHAYNTPLIANRFREPFSIEKLRTNPFAPDGDTRHPVLVHGFKDQNEVFASAMGLMGL